MQDEAELLNGDSISIQMIFTNNLFSGRNFSGQENMIITWQAVNQLGFPSLAPDKLFIAIE